MPWSEGSSTPSTRSVYRYVNVLEPVLATMADHDTAMVSAVLFKVLSQPGLEYIRMSFLFKPVNETILKKLLS
jgi:hypothetical protein